MFRLRYRKMPRVTWLTATCPSLIALAMSLLRQTKGAREPARFKTAYSSFTWAIAGVRFTKNPIRSFPY